MKHSHTLIIARILLLIIALILLAGCSKDAETSTPITSPLNGTKPNIIVIFTDDQGFADLSIHDVVADIKTPHIDALARGGALMTNGYVTAPQCVPSRAGLLSGQYQDKIGIQANKVLGKNTARGTFHDVVTIAERLKSAGYATGMTGKWHLGPSPQISEHGFDSVYQTVGYINGYWNMDLDGQDIRPQKAPPSYHLDTSPKFASAFIKKHADKPFFFYWAPRAPHVPVDAAQKYLDRFPGEMPKRRRHALAMMSAVDDGVGEIMKTLRATGLEENTLVFFISDNGAPYKMIKADAGNLRSGWNGSLNNPLAGEKGMLTEGGIRTPFLVYWKDQIPAGTIYDHPVISLDVAATAIELAGLEKPEELPGTNIIPYLTQDQKSEPHEALYWRWQNQAAIRKGDWKYLQHEGQKYLFKVSEDKSETRNLAAQNPDLVADLSRELEVWGDTLVPPGLDAIKVGRGRTSTYREYFDFYLGQE